MRCYYLDFDGNMERIKKHLQKLDLPNEFISEFFQKAEVLEITKNDFLVKQDDICQYIGIVERGSLFANIENDNADVIVSELYQENSFITSYRSFLTQTYSPGNIQAYSDSKVYVIPYKIYLSLMKSSLWLQFFKLFSDTLFINKCKKETSLIKLSAKERYNQLINSRPNIEQLFPQYLIASYLKIRPETLSRIKSLDLHQHKA